MLLSLVSVSHISPVCHNSAPPPPLPPPRYARGPRRLTAQQRRGSLGRAPCRHCQGKKRQYEYSKTALTLKYEYLILQHHLHYHVFNSIGMQGGIEDTNSKWHIYSKKPLHTIFTAAYSQSTEQYSKFPANICFSFSCVCL